MVNRMIVANVLHRPVRTIISVLAVAIEVSMVMLVVGMTTGLLHEAAKRVEGVGAAGIGGGHAVSLPLGPVGMNRSNLRNLDATSGRKLPASPGGRARRFCRA